MQDIFDGNKLYSEAEIKKAAKSIGLVAEKSAGTRGTKIEIRLKGTTVWCFDGTAGRFAMEFRNSQLLTSYTFDKQEALKEIIKLADMVAKFGRSRLENINTATAYNNTLEAAMRDRAKQLLDLIDQQL